MTEYKRLARSLLITETGFLIAIIVFVPLGTGYLNYIEDPPITNWGLNFEESEVFQMKIHKIEINYEFTGNKTNIVMIEQGLYLDSYFPTNHGSYRGAKMPLFNFSGKSVSNQIINFEVVEIDYESTKYGVDGKTVDVATILIVDRGTSMIIPAHSNLARSPVSIDFRGEINGSYLFEKSRYLPIFDSENSRNAFNERAKKGPWGAIIAPEEKISEDVFIFPTTSVHENQEVYTGLPLVSWTFYHGTSRFKFVNYTTNGTGWIDTGTESIRYACYINLEIEWIYPEMISK